jgi:hypothetical protein
MKFRIAYNSKTRRCNIIVAYVHIATGNKGDHVLKWDTLSHPKNLIARSTTMLPPRNIHTYYWGSPNGNTQSDWSHLQRKEDGDPVYWMFHRPKKLTVILIAIWWLQKSQSHVSKQTATQKFDMETNQTTWKLQNSDRLKCQNGLQLCRT